MHFPWDNPPTSQIPAWGGRLAARPTAKPGGRATFPRQKESSRLFFSLALTSPLAPSDICSCSQHRSHHIPQAMVTRLSGEVLSVGPSQPQDCSWCWAQSSFMNRSTSDFSPGSRKAPSPKCSLEGLDACFILPFPKWQLLHLHQFISWLHHPAVVLQGIHILQCVPAPEAMQCHCCRASPRQLWVHKQTAPRPKGMLSIPTNSHSSAHTSNSSFSPARKRSATTDRAVGTASQQQRHTWAKNQQHRQSPVRDLWYQGRRNEESKSVKVGRFRPDQSSEHCFHALCAVVLGRH